LKNIFENKSILVTGGTGSIGSEIVRQVLDYKPRVIRVYSRDETRQLELQKGIGDKSNVRFLIGDIRDKERLEKAVEDIDFVFHAAALKHVPACEYNPFESVKTNVLGTQNLIDVALEEEIERFISISTDKAVNPTSTMGATKLLSERLACSANRYRGKRRTLFSCVRFGNVLASRGSIIPMLLHQIQTGAPITITDERMTRFIMSIPQAVKLVLKSLTMARGGEIFILKMPSVRIIDLIEVFIDEFVYKRGKYKKKIKIEEVKSRPGEKLYEELMTSEEAKRAYETEELLIIPSESNEEYKKYANAQPVRRISYTSRYGPQLTKEQIRDMLCEAFRSMNGSRNEEITLDKKIINF
jgi:FlaA1/EpsC-like NDP-sugar epimerase